MAKLKKIIFNALPILLMIGLIPMVKNDYFLAVLYFVIICVFFSVHYEKKEWTILVAGAVVMFFSELFFISTNVETFNRASLFGKMPVWLPLLWGLGFVCIKRFIKLIGY